MLTTPVDYEGTSPILWFLSLSTPKYQDVRIQVLENAVTIEYLNGMLKYCCNTHLENFKLIKVGIDSSHKKLESSVIHVK